MVATNREYMDAADVRTKQRVADMSWEPVMRMDPQRRGVIVSITDGKTFSIVGRVAFARWGRSSTRWRTFKQSLQVVWTRAEAQADEANGQPVQAAEKRLPSSF